MPKYSKSRATVTVTEWHCYILGKKCLFLKALYCFQQKTVVINKSTITLVLMEHPPRPLEVVQCTTYTTVPSVLILPLSGMSVLLNSEFKKKTFL